ncbi:MAG: hypothetical protein MZU95_04120 [Desulfomicrobium escambiense]|nr:hypothetical protein [Desulfomicrobium escambiense]
MFLAIVMILSFQLVYVFKKSDINAFAEYNLKDQVESFENLKNKDVEKLSAVLFAIKENECYKKAFLSKNPDELYLITKDFLKILKQTAILLIFILLTLTAKFF